MQKNKKKNRGFMFIILSGASGSGKDTVKKELLERIDNLTTIPSFTTRSPRDEEDKKRYFFVTEQEFKELIKNGEVYEYSIHHGNYYGTSKKELDKKISSGFSVIKDIDVNGTMNLVKTFKDIMKVVTIFLKVDKKELQDRLRKRGTSKEEIELRLSRVDYEEQYIDSYDYVIVNDNLEKTVNEIEKIIEKEK